MLPKCKIKNGNLIKLKNHVDIVKCWRDLSNNCHIDCAAFENVEDGIRCKALSIERNKGQFIAEIPDTHRK